MRCRLTNHSYLYYDNANVDSWLGGFMTILLTQEEFDDLFRKWDEAINYSSLMQDILTDPYYLKILKYGEGALPYIFAKIKESGFSLWFCALQSIVYPDSNLPDDFPVNLLVDNENMTHEEDLDHHNKYRKRVEKYWLKYATTHGCLPQE